MAGPVIEAVRERVRANHPLAAAIADGVRREVPGANVPAVVDAVQTAIAATPAAANAVNAEPLRQSRVVSGSAVAIITGLGALLSQLGPMLDALQTGLDTGGKWATVLGFLFGGGAFGGGIFALLGRIRDNLPPMTRKWWNPFSWFAPQPGP